jgi:thiol-disulfide isomerase/thioredoxin
MGLRLTAVLCLAAVAMLPLQRAGVCAESGDAQGSAFARFRKGEIVKFRDFVQSLNKKKVDPEEGRKALREYAGKMIDRFREFRETDEGSKHAMEINSEIITIAIQLLGESKTVKQVIDNTGDKEQANRLRLQAINSYAEIDPREAKPFVLDLVEATKGEESEMREVAEKMRFLFAPAGLEFPKFPEFAKDTEDKPIRLSQYKGNHVLVDFWASWCGPCIREMPNVVKAYKKYHPKGFDIIGISLDEKKDGMQAAMKKFNMTWRQYFDGGGWDNKVAGHYGVGSIPAMFLVGPDGKIVARVWQGELEETLAKVYGDEKAATPEKPAAKSE